jgi:hypothetical protein
VATACGSAKGGSVGGRVCARPGYDRDLKAIAGLQTGRASAAAAVVAEDCKLPAPLTSALAEVATGDCLRAARGIAESPTEFLRACPAGHDSVRVLQEHGDDGMGLLVDRCDLPRLGFATRDELAGSHHWACLLLGSMVYVELDAAGEPSARQAARLIALDRP